MLEKCVGLKRGRNREIPHFNILFLFYRLNKINNKTTGSPLEHHCHHQISGGFSGAENIDIRDPSSNTKTITIQPTYTKDTQKNSAKIPWVSIVYGKARSVSFSSSMDVPECGWAFSVEVLLTSFTKQLEDTHSKAPAGELFQNQNLQGLSEILPIACLSFKRSFVFIFVLLALFTIFYCSHLNCFGSLRGNAVEK